MTTFRITPQGPFSLAEAAAFGFGPHTGRTVAAFDGTLRLAFCLDDHGGHAGVAVTCRGSAVHGEITDAPPGTSTAAVRAQVARILSLDVDARGFAAVCAADPVVAPVAMAAPGLRPVLFGSPYEAAAWAVLSLRWGRRQAAVVRERLSRAHGAEITVAGEPLLGFPTPEALLRVDIFAGISAVKLRRLHGVARAALAGTFDVARLREGDRGEVMATLRELPGIGPFSAALVRLRSTGVSDDLVDAEPRLAGLVGRHYRLGHDATPDELARIAESWRPFRTWVAVLLRAASDRVPDEQESAA